MPSPTKSLRVATDIAANWADPTLAERKLGWKAVYDIDALCRDAFNFQQHLEN